MMNILGGGGREKSLTVQLITNPTPPKNSVAAAFTNVVTSFVSDILLPPLSVLLPLNANLDLKFAVLQAGPSYADLPRGYTTIEQAQADGAVIMAYGVFLNKTLNFIGLGSALYALAGCYQYLSKDPIIKHMVKCRYCRKNINEKVSRVGLVPRVSLCASMCVCVCACVCVCVCLQPVDVY
jgi:large-conductance mechanosensitive channel